VKQRESVCPLPNTATSESLYPQKSKPSFFYLISLSTLSICFTSLSLLHVCLSPSVSGAPLSLSLSLSPSPPHSAVNPFFYLIISLTHVLHSLSLSVFHFSLCFMSLSLPLFQVCLSLSLAALPSFDCYSIPLSSTSI
jgi:hypothetical protein